MRAHIDDILTAEFAIIEFAGFDGEPIFGDASGRRQNMCMMIALISIPMRGMNGNISDYAVAIHKIGGEADGKVLALICYQV